MTDSSPHGDHGTARVEGQNDQIKIGSPLAVLGLFVEIVRARFREPNTDTGYVWRSDPTPLDTEENTPEAPRFLYIEAGEVSDPEARDMRPAVFVAKGESQLSQDIIGNRSTFDRQTRTERFRAPARIPMQLACVSENRAESAILGDHVWFHIASSTNYARAEFGINHISLPSLSGTSLVRRSEAGPDVYQTMVSFDITIEFHWITRPVAPLLKEVRSHLLVAGEGDAAIGALAVTQRMTRTR